MKLTETMTPKYQGSIKNKLAGIHFQLEHYVDGCFSAETMVFSACIPGLFCKSFNILGYFPSLYRLCGILYMVIWPLVFFTKSH